MKKCLLIWRRRIISKNLWINRMRDSLRFILGLNQLKETNRAKCKVRKSRLSDLKMIINLK